MEKLDIVFRIAELVIAIVTSAVITRIITLRQRVRMEKSAADKAAAEAKADQIENIEKMMQKAYSPIIEGLTKQVQSLQTKVEKLEAEKDKQDQRIEELEYENRQLRAALREVCPDSLPSRRGANGKNALRNPDGTFAKKEGGNEAQS